MWGIPDTHLSLEEYWQFLQIEECAGYGIRGRPGELTGKGCGDYWNQDERYWLAESIAKAEKRLEKDRHLGYPLRRKYYGVELYDYGRPVILRRTYVRGIGVEATSVFAAGTAITLSPGGIIADPVTVSIAVTFTDEDELIIYYPGQTRYTIRPSSVTISGGVATIEIPRCRLLKPAYFINYTGALGYQDTDRPDYNTDSYFLTSVDIGRNYLNTQTGSNLVWRRYEPMICCLGGGDAHCEPTTPCGETLQLACGYIVDQRLGVAQFEPATYSSGWAKANFAVSRCPDAIQTNYMAGRWDRYEDMDEDIIRAVIAIAHNNLPEDYCACAMQERYYKRDRNPIEGGVVRLALGPSTWGILEANEIVHENTVMRGMFM